MSFEESWPTAIDNRTNNVRRSDSSGFDQQTGIYHSLLQLGDDFQIPTRHDLDTSKYVLSQFPHPDRAESRVALIDSATITKSPMLNFNDQSVLLPPAFTTVWGPERRVGSGAAPLSKELTEEFRERFPWVELRQGYGLTESCGAATFLSPMSKLRHIQVAPAELEAILLNHPQVLDAAVIPLEDEEAGQIPMAYVVAPYKKVRKVAYQCNSKVSCRQNPEEGTCFT
ncbi:hypothetical protein GH714_032613 [Hevea brasiliensis]|uniref:AMP-dependent synthetase/ligase domain-containing protein n=1 Tax=Hevea brasiliensis TaxID=3981 RepID=A0A6A6L5J7_HEVBR|nr:hypothetical protein GH714_032613 [Hevea brasiliensis]